jgi:hypothetical protein
MSQRFEDLWRPIETVGFVIVLVVVAIAYAVFRLSD